MAKYILLDQYISPPRRKISSLEKLSKVKELRLKGELCECRQGVGEPRLENVRKFDFKVRSCTFFFSRAPNGSLRIMEKLINRKL